MSENERRPDDELTDSAPDDAEATGAAADDADAAEVEAGPGVARRAPPAASEHVERVIEALLFVSDAPVTPAHLAKTLHTEAAVVRAALESLAARSADRGVQVVEVGGGWQMRTQPAYANWVQQYLQAKPVRLSRASLETLAIIAYRQPITRPDVEAIRGVDCGGVLKLLHDRSLVKVLGKKDEPGRPLLYGTTSAFLELFGLKSLRDLPTLRDFAELTEEHRALVEAAHGPFAAGEGNGETDDAQTVAFGGAQANDADANANANANADADAAEADPEADVVKGAE